MLKAGIIGTGNIGTDLLIKIIKSGFIEPVIFAGRRKDSDGIKRAIEYNIPISYNGINYFISNLHICDVVFDCTNAHDAIYNYQVFKEKGIKVIDMTPSKLGEMCIPTINPEIIKEKDNINMITCGGQASIPILNELDRICEGKISYIEIVSQVSSKSVGLATRNNIDEYISTTENAIKKFTKCKDCKVILNINPAYPCVNMQTSMFIERTRRDLPDNLLNDINKKILEVKSYVPYYDLTMLPIVDDNGILILSVKVTGSGDYLPSYAGNLDIINCAAIEVVKQLI